LVALVYLLTSLRKRGDEAGEVDLGLLLEPHFKRFWLARRPDRRDEAFGPGEFFTWRMRHKEREQPD